MFNCSIGDKEHDGYVLEDIGLGGRYGDYVSGKLCLNCGQMQGTWPLPTTELEQTETEEETHDEDLETWVVFDLVSGRYMKSWKVWTEQHDLSSAQIFSGTQKREWESDKSLNKLGPFVAFKRL